MDLFPVYLHLLDRFVKLHWPFPIFSIRYPPQQQSQELKRMNRLISSWSVLKLYCCRQQWTKRTLEVLIPKLLGFFNAPNQTNEFLGKDIDSILGKNANPNEVIIFSGGGSFSREFGFLYDTRKWVKEFVSSFPKNKEDEGICP
jgi:hypothetical protein